MNNTLSSKIADLKKKHNAVILAHNYQLAEVQDLADFTGDSLELSIIASQTKADTIVFCGVYFMAETAKILNPNKLVIMPDINAGCPMADMITAFDVDIIKQEYPNAAVVCYVNSSAEVKAVSDICCTSANAPQVVRSINASEIIFIPDKYLGQYTQTIVKEKKYIFWNGYCPTHAKILPEDIDTARKAHEKALVLVHPECRPETISMADKALSTGGMLKFVKESKSREFIIGTEVGMIHRLQKDNPDKIFYPINNKVTCPNMKLTTAEKVLWSLEDLPAGRQGLKTEVTVPQDISNKARLAIEKMLVIGRQD